MSYTSTSAQNSTVHNSANVASFLCPTDPNWPQLNVSATNYPNNIGLVRAAPGSSTLFVDGPAYKVGQAPEDSPFRSRRSPTGFDTVIFSEMVKGKGQTAAPYVGSGLNLVFDSGVPETPGMTPQGFQTACLKGTTAVYDQKGTDWLLDDCAKGGCYSHIMAPNTKGCWYGSSATPTTLS